MLTLVLCLSLAGGGLLVLAVSAVLAFGRYKAFRRQLDETMEKVKAVQDQIAALPLPS